MDCLHTCWSWLSFLTDLAMDIRLAVERTWVFQRCVNWMQHFLESELILFSVHATVFACLAANLLGLFFFSLSSAAAKLVCSELDTLARPLGDAPCSKNTNSRTKKRVRVSCLSSVLFSCCCTMANALLRQSHFYCLSKCNCSLKTRKLAGDALNYRWPLWIKQRSGNLKAHFSLMTRKIPLNEHKKKTFNSGTNFQRNVLLPLDY